MRTIIGCLGLLIAAFGGWISATFFITGFNVGGGFAGMFASGFLGVLSFALLLQKSN